MSKGNMMKKPVLIIIDGPNGAGKTTLAKLLHSKMKRTAFIHWDTLKKLISDFKPGKRDHGLAQKVTYSMANMYLANGISVVFEAFWGTKENLNNFLKTVKIPKSRIFIYQLEAPFEVRIKRAKEGWLSGKRKRLLPPAHIKKNDKSYSSKRFPNSQMLDSHKLPTSQMVRQILKDL